MAIHPQADVNPVGVQTPRTRYFFWVDGLRGLGAVSVLIFHYHQFFGTGVDTAATPDPGKLPFFDYLSLLYLHGDAAVQLFWVISGFVLAEVYVDREKRATAREFFVHRFARLYPLHFVTLLVVAALQAISMEALGHAQIYGNNDTYHFLLNLGFVSAWGFERGFSFNAPIWSVSVEIFLYVVFFLSIPSLQRAWGGVLALLMTGLCCVLLVAKVSETNIWLCGAFFYAGCWTFALWKRLNRYGAIAPLLVGTVGFGVASAAVLLLRSLANHVIVYELLAFPASVLAVASLDRFDRLKMGQRVRAFGDLTYSLYLWHIPLQILVLVLIQRYALNSNIAASYGFFFAYLALMFCIAWASFHGLELPLRIRLRKALAPRRVLART